MTAPRRAGGVSPHRGGSKELEGRLRWSSPRAPAVTQPQFGPPPCTHLHVTWAYLTQAACPVT